MGHVNTIFARSTQAHQPHFFQGSQDSGLEAPQRQRRSPQSLQSPTQSSHADFERGQSPAPEPEMINQEDTPKTFRPVIELLFSTCLDVLRTVVVRYPIHQDDFSGTADRLATWGTGLFRGPVTIDQALNTDSRGVTSLENNISGTLSDIAVVLSKFITLHTHVSVIVNSLNVVGRLCYRVIDHSQ